MTRHLTKQLDKRTEAIVKSYDADKRTQRIDTDFLPSSAAIVDTIADLRQLLFPGFFESQPLAAVNLHYHVGTLVAHIGKQVAGQVYHCLCYGSTQGDGPCMTHAISVAGALLDRIPAVRRMLALDAQAAYDGDPAAKSIDEVIYCYPGFYAIVVYRLAHELVSLGVPLMPRIMTEHAHSHTGCDIHPGAAIGESFFIDHATGVVIGETTKIGNFVKMYQGVTLGALSFPKDERGRVIKGLKRHPTIEDHVTIYANATILGGATVIGRGATVAGNSFITESVAPNTVAGNKMPELTLRPKKRGKKAKT